MRNGHFNPLVDGAAHVQTNYEKRKHGYKIQIQHSTYLTQLAQRLSLTEGSSGWSGSIDPAQVGPLHNEADCYVLRTSETDSS